ncbi:MAG TPA: aldose 1-epimerase [Caldimonas sp.]|jgi:aldose 1-epimerase
MTGAVAADAADAASDASARFELRAGALRLAVRPDLGGAVAGLWHGETPILRSTEPGMLGSAREAAMFPLVPYSNRLGYRRLRWRGRDYTTGANIADSPHSLHGVGWQRPWRIVSSSALEVVLELRHEADADWPFAFTARQYLALDAASFSARLQLANDAAIEQPAGLGWHPNFARRARSRMHVELSHRWDADATLLPTRKVAQHGIDSDLSHLAFDNCFEGWRGPARIRDERFSLQLSSSLTRLVVYTPADRDYFSVEPVSHVSNAIHMADPAAHGVVSLAPAATIEAWMRLDVAVL